MHRPGPSFSSDTRPKAARRGLLGLLLLGLSPAIGHAGGPDARKPAPVDFTREIRPILADKCFRCHGPDAGQRKGKLRLDNARAATAPAASGSPAIVPGHAS